MGDDGTRNEARRRGDYGERCVDEKEQQDYARLVSTEENGRKLTHGSRHDGPIDGSELFLVWSRELFKRMCCSSACCILWEMILCPVFLLSTLFAFKKNLSIYTEDQ